jgi:halimadienyl-diphosphate synthase
VPGPQWSADAVVRSLLAHPWGQVTPSAYETGRVLSLAPWLPGAARRVAFLLDSQRPDGAWCGTPGADRDGYALVPTLSAVEGLLAVAMRREHAEAAVLPAVDRGLRAAWRWLTSGTPVPDTPAIEVIVPVLIAAVNAHLDRLAAAAMTGLDSWSGEARLPVPDGMDDGLVTAVRSRLARGEPLPLKLLHSLEVLGSAGTVRPTPPGTVGASPAATAAWLAEQDGARDPDALRYLGEVAGQHGGPVPSVIPITMFERSWVLSALRSAGVEVAVPEALVDELAASLGPTGTSGGAGLPPDADTTSVVLLTLAQLGRQPDVDCLLAYRDDGHFCVWKGERTASTTANAHVLEALGHHMWHHRSARPRYRPVVIGVADWLAEQQRADGSWTDKWHASAYYATACCALALHRYGGSRVAPVVGRAVAWLLATQDSAGGWGRWGATPEETAYALQVLLLAGGDRSAEAAVSGYAYLRQAYGQQPDPPLWHDKDLYRPTAVVRSAALAALHLARPTLAHRATR